VESRELEATSPRRIAERGQPIGSGSQGGGVAVEADQAPGRGGPPTAGRLWPPPQRWHRSAASRQGGAQDRPSGADLGKSRDQRFGKNWNVIKTTEPWVPS